MTTRIFFLCFVLLAVNLVAAETLRTQVVLLGTGTPNPDPQHSGCSIAIVVDSIPYIVDFGPGLVRQAAALSPRYGGPVDGLAVKKIKRAFLTHLHSDHTTGFADLIFTPWVMGRDEPLQVYGPEGTEELTRHLLAAYEQDIHYRLYGSEPANDQGWRVEVTEYKSGEIYRDDLVTVEAFRVKHGAWPNAFGFRFSTPDKVIVISGDTAPCQAVIDFSRNADILIHEVYSKKGFDERDPIWQEYHKAHHTSTLELGEIAGKARPGVVILYHILYWGSSDQDLLDEVGSVYDGTVLVGKDLEIYE